MVIPLLMKTTNTYILMSSDGTVVQLSRNERMMCTSLFNEAPGPNFDSAAAFQSRRCSISTVKTASLNHPSL
jgi:hypothetical protein